MGVCLEKIDFEQLARICFPATKMMDYEMEFSSASIANLVTTPLYMCDHSFYADKSQPLCIGYGWGNLQVYHT